jgi:integrase
MKPLKIFLKQLKRLILKALTGVTMKRSTSLSGRHISPHGIRHATAMHLLQSGVDISAIALWLGHESPKTTYMYVEADLAMKERALARLQEPGMTALRYRAPDSLLQFLKSL